MNVKMGNQCVYLFCQGKEQANKQKVFPTNFHILSILDHVCKIYKKY